MLKRGQFYLMAAIVIIVILSGLSHVYSSIRVINDKLDLNGLTEEIHFETRNLIDNRMYAGKTEGEIAGNIKNITDFYSNKYLGVKIVAVYGDESQLYIINESVTSTVPSGGVINVSIVGEIRGLDIKSGQNNLYILAGKNDQGQKTIAVS